MPQAHPDRLRIHCAASGARGAEHDLPEHLCRGYPDDETRPLPEADLLDYDARLAHFRRYSDPRYYKGVEYADVAESLARRRCAELFAANGYGPEQVYVNVQALSGAPANNAVYSALVNPGDTV